MFVSVITGALSGLDSFLVNVEVDASPGLPVFQMVGSLNNEVRESKDRVRVALKNTGFMLPAQSINVNLSPANIRKEGTSYDLPIAVGILSTLGDISPRSFENTLIIGELGLNGEVKGVRGILPIVQAARKNGIQKVILPSSNSKEGALIPEIKIIPVSNLSDVFMYLSAPEDEADDIIPPVLHSYTSMESIMQPDFYEDFADVHGQASVKRAAMVAAAGFHHMLMIGPPGAGKTMIAKRIPGILPALTVEEALDVTSIYSIAGLLSEDMSLISKRPFLSPHHTITEQALAGGGKIPRPGVISLAHRGVLFLDEMTEFNRTTLDIMRQPLEEKTVHISRIHSTYHYPADFMLIAACNPCPCGYYPNMNKCHCSEPQVMKYLNRISGPLLDRIDICCNVEPTDPRCLASTPDSQLSSAHMREQIEIARIRQAKRFESTGIRFNGEMTGKQIEQLCTLGPAEQLLMDSAYESMGLSARSYHRILKVSRTIADLEDSDNIQEEHIAEAIHYRTSGSRFWGK